MLAMSSDIGEFPDNSRVYAGRLLSRDPDVRLYRCGGFGKQIMIAGFPLHDLALGLLRADAKLFLQLRDQVIAFAVDPLDMLIRQFGPLFFDSVCRSRPCAFYEDPVHV
jgi:hypothetical protein